MLFRKISDTNAEFRLVTSTRSRSFVAKWMLRSKRFEFSTAFLFPRRLFCSPNFIFVSLQARLQARAAAAAIKTEQ